MGGRVVQNMRRSERGLQQHLPIFSVNQNKHALKNKFSTDVKVAITLLAMKASNKII